MNVQELVGQTIWIKNGQFRTVPGEIKSVLDAAMLDDTQSSINQSTFKIQMLSGEVCEVLGSDISEIACSKHP